MYRTSPSISTLITLLETQQARFDAFLALLEKERSAIKSLASALLVDISEAKLKLLDEIRGLEAQRAAVVVRLAGNWGVAVESLTLRAIAGRLGPIEAGIMLRLHERLTKAVSAVREATTLNGDLIARSLAFLSQGMDVWRSAPRTSSLYSPYGSFRHGSRQGQLVEQKG